MALATQELELFVRDALSRGQSREAIEALLGQRCFDVDAPKPE